jgi:hypothetical protein
MKTIDFKSDLKSAILNELAKIGVNISIKQDAHTVLVDFLNIQKKIIPSRKRKVLFNPEFKENLVNHPHIAVIKRIIDYATKGKNLNCFQSRKLFQTKFNDHLRNEWNIFHLHLSLEKDNKSDFVKQVNSLLFVYIDSKTFLLLGTDKHSEGVFGDKKWLEIIHKYHPELIENYRSDNIVGLNNTLTPVERQKGWESGLSSGYINIGNANYLSPGFGMVTSGRNIEIIDKANRISNWIFEIEKLFYSQRIDICKSMNISDVKSSFKLQFANNKIEIIEETSKLRVIQYPYIRIFKYDL